MQEEKPQRWRRLLIGLGCAVVVIALFYIEEDVRGYLAWHSYKRQVEAKGEKVDWLAVIPAPVPDDENFAMAPIVATSYGNLLTPDGKIIPPGKRDPNYVNRLSMHPDAPGISDDPKNGTGNWQTATLSDLTAWQRYYRALVAKTNEFPVPAVPQTPAADVLLALGIYDSDIEEVRQAGQLPQSRFPVSYNDEDTAAILLPHLAALKACSQVLQLRAIAELQNNQPDKAMDDVKLMLRLADSIRTEPFIITHLVRIAVIQIALQPVYEGLANHQWSGAQLAELYSKLSNLDFLADYKHSIDGERAANMRFIGWVGRNQGQLKGIMSDFGAAKQNTQSMTFYLAALHLAPSGWFYQNEVEVAKLDELWLTGSVDDAQQTVSPQEVSRTANSIKRSTRHFGPSDFLASLFVGGLEGYPRRIAYGQNAVDLARVAIALERYRLANGGFPASLDALAPDYLPQVPHDIIGGQPLHYKATQDGQFVLYSIGWNEKDDGGTVAFRNHSQGIVDISSGDWVWRYPAKN
jgi:hypothetical protein